jgi:predicted CXXCH cytochrome family protein
MKKVLIGFVAIASLLLVTYGSSYAIQGQCVNCHTMHASQNGTFPTGMTSGPNEYLLLAGCIACHSGATGTATNSFSAPIVLRTNAAPGGQGGTYTLAGGDFYWVADGGLNTDSMGHNVVGISGQDAAIAANIGYTPPGWHAGATPGQLGDGQVNAGVATWSSQLNCAGQLGCHGKHDVVGDFPGIKGAHHGNTGIATTQANNPTTVGGSFRFLSGINGLEHSQWNWGETTGLHNEYNGDNNTANRNQSYTTYANKRTISYLCAECHGYYHSQIDDTTTGTPWLRHPTDIVLGRGAGTEYIAYNPDAGNAYSLEAPVARPTVPATSSAIVLPNDSSGDTGAIVMCLSCHRAHGSNQADILRWDYTAMIASSGTSDTGCFTCHTTKNAD